MQIVIDDLNREAVEQMVSLMEEYLNSGYFMSPMRTSASGQQQWFLVPLDVLDEGFFN